MQRELKILHKLDHPNIIKLYGKITDHTNSQVYSMVFPWMDGGDLAHYLLEKRKDIPLNRRLDIVSKSPSDRFPVLNISFAVSGA